MTEERWMDTGSGPGAMVRVHVTQADVRVRTAYRAWLDHAVACRGCQAGHGRACETARPLWAAYTAARR
jgi:hypothetical protein